MFEFRNSFVNTIMRNFINLFESDDETEGDDFAWEREKHVMKLIRFAFDKIGLRISDNSYGLTYTDEDREADVVLDEVVDGFSLDHLMRLRETGLSDDYRIDARDHEIAVKFKVHPDIDNAKLP